MSEVGRRKSGRPSKEKVQFTVVRQQRQGHSPEKEKTERQRPTNAVFNRVTQCRRGVRGGNSDHLASLTVKTLKRRLGAVSHVDVFAGNVKPRCDSGYCRVFGVVAQPVRAADS